MIEKHYCGCSLCFYRSYGLQEWYNQRGRIFWPEVIPKNFVDEKSPFGQAIIKSTLYARINFPDGKTNPTIQELEINYQKSIHE